MSPWTDKGRDRKRWLRRGVMAGWGYRLNVCPRQGGTGRHAVRRRKGLSLIHISEPTRLDVI
eukprot:3751471-Prorocentrum_lima.AAC.1